MLPLGFPLPLLVSCGQMYVSTSPFSCDSNTVALLTIEEEGAADEGEDEGPCEMCAVTRYAEMPGVIFPPVIEVGKRGTEPAARAS